MVLSGIFFCLRCTENRCTIRFMVIETGHRRRQAGSWLSEEKIMTTYANHTVNAAGLSEIAAFLAAHHQRLTV